MAIGSVATSFGSVTSWTAATGNWTTASNWSTGAPTTTISAVIDNKGTARLATGFSGSSDHFFIDDGSLIISGGNLTTARDATIGFASSRVDMSGGNWTIGNDFTVGGQGGLISPSREEISP